jgi:hypothetical protein
MLYVKNASKKRQALIFDGKDLPYFYSFLLGKIEGYNEMILGNVFRNDAISCISPVYYFSVQQTCRAVGLDLLLLCDHLFLPLSLPLF